MAKTAISVDKDMLQRAVNDAEQTQFSTIGAMLDAVTEVYNSYPDCKTKITASTVRNRIAEFGITYKTEAGKKGRGKTSIEVDRPRLESILKDIEKDGPLANRTLLYNEIARRYSEGGTSISASVVYLRIEDWKLECKTPKAKLRNVGAKPVVVDDTEVQAEEARLLKEQVHYGKQGTREQNSIGMRHMVKDHKFKGGIALVKRIEGKNGKRGSAMAAIKLNCLQCCGFEKKEVKYCTCPGCPLFRFRPYQGKKKGVVELPLV